VQVLLAIEVEADCSQVEMLGDCSISIPGALKGKEPGSAGRVVVVIQKELP
jgi:hypothetical protein